MHARLQVVQAKMDAKHGYTALQLGIGAKRAKRMPAKERGHFLEAGVPLKRMLTEFRVSLCLSLTGPYYLYGRNCCCQCRARKSTQGDPTRTSASAG